ncbi:MAG TPA: hypothetical protein VNF73_10205, partial [Candidatus Saccharimonadales bacterium]|nr:hypothetical protein [Candidatus Saccharimonadales bacterium]
GRVEGFDLGALLPAVTDLAEQARARVATLDDRSRTDPVETPAGLAIPGLTPPALGRSPT